MQNNIQDEILNEDNLDDDIENEDVSDEEETKEKEKKHLISNPVHREIVSYVIIVIAALLCASLINEYVLFNNEVPTGSMKPTIVEGSRLFSYRLAYLNDDPERGDIVVFNYPVDESQYFVKRVIGLPGEKVEIIDGKVYINDEALDESAYLTSQGTGNFGPYYVPEDSYFMLGDNRNGSSDSRAWNLRALEAGLVVDEEHDYTFVHKDKIISKAGIQYYPKIKVLK